MREKIQPKYYREAKVSCASCGAEWTTGSTVPEIRTEVCSNCHPFYTGQQARILDREGQVDRFYKRLQVRQEIVAEKRAQAEAKTSPDRPVSEFKLTTKAVAALAKADIHTAGDVLRRREGIAGDRRIWSQIIDRSEKRSAPDGLYPARGRRRDRSLVFITKKSKKAGSRPAFFISLGCFQ